MPSVSFDRTVLNQTHLPGRRSQLCSLKLTNISVPRILLFSFADFPLFPSLLKFPLALERQISEASLQKYTQYALLSTTLLHRTRY